ncbi:putative hydrolase or acyltransferase of alpha/beta superfamily [Actinoalloteichus hymeniacidonis]|uniref:Hydrolase or acyltransferase of alpha/beta superfamily n=1 Tax=Actinoalloteichus hymeniacidonis TaxID=340345 RepID=A0AAC9MX88_9PSEU|nr:putative hydrolase or acyltransferase of alpha/beta superfamily [Actinoalloteichus hymeniacidonis]
MPMSDAALPPLDLNQRPWPGRTIRVDGTPIHVRETPAENPDAETAVYLHGLAGSASNWTDLAGLLRVQMSGVAVDLPGFGRSAPPDGFRYTPAAHVRTVVRLLESRGGRPVHLLGNSFGGLVASIVAAARPDLVATLTLISPAVPDLRPSPDRLADPRFPLSYLPFVGKPVRRALAAMTPLARAEQMMRLCFARPDRVPKHRLEEAAAEIARLGRTSWAGPALDRTTTAMIRFWLTRGDRSLWRVLPRVAAPTLVIWGTEDRLMSARKALRTATALPNGRLLMLPFTGHVAQMERPVLVAKAVLGMVANPWPTSPQVEKHSAALDVGRLADTPVGGGDGWGRSGDMAL